MSNQPFVERPPSILNKPDGSAQFECIVQGHPEPEVKWYFKGEELENDDRHVIKKKKMVGKFACTLVIKQPCQADQGVYRVEATNSYGTHFREQTYTLVQTGNSMYPDA